MLFSDDLQIGYQFTFNLSKPEDRHVRQINFFNVPTETNVDTDFDIIASKSARIKISAKESKFAGIETFYLYCEHSYKQLLTSRARSQILMTFITIKHD